MNISPETRLSLYRRMLRVRLFEEKIIALYPQQQMRCPVHLSIGQEATAAGMCEALSRKDIVFTNHRSHGHYVAKGGSLLKMMAELYGRESGCCGGIGGSMHVMDPSVGVLATIPIVAGIIPIAVGTAFAHKMDRTGVVTTVFLGDAAIEEGVFHESVNFAVLKSLPIIFFCENNLYSVYTPLKYRQPDRPIWKLVEGHGISSCLIDGNDVSVVYETAMRSYLDIKEGKGPIFIEATTYRWREHCGPNYDNDIGYRTEEEFLSWKEKCPVERGKRYLLASGNITQDQLDFIGIEIQEEIDDAVEFAKNSPFPQWSKVIKYVYA